MTSVESTIPFAAERWSTWFPGERAPALQAGVLIEPSHRHRPLVFLIPTNARTPRVVLKVALTQLEAGALRTEFNALSRLRPSLPGGLRESIPDPVGLERTTDRTVLVLRGMKGRRPLPPRFSRRPSVGGRRHLLTFVDSAFGWTRRLADATTQPTEVDEAALADRVARFGAAFAKDGGEARALRSFGRAIENTRIRWTPSWQHGDIGFGNALVHRGRVGFVDWEQARPSSEPWFDVSYLPLALAGMARRQRGDPSLQRASACALASSAWSGSIVRARLQHGWDYPLPIAWAVALTSMWKALRLRREGRLGWADLALGLVVDAELRRALAWMAPQW